MTQARRLSPYVCVAIALLIVFWRIIRIEAAPGSHLELLPHLQIVKTYNYTILLSNYFTEGFVRRGIPGSIFYLLRDFGVENRLILFHLVCALWLSIPLLILLQRLAQTQGRAWIWLQLVLALSPPLFMAWARDVAKADMMTAGFIVWALLACLDRRYVLAAIAIFAASQVHEIGLIYGGPLCVAIGFVDLRAGKVRSSQGFVALGLLIGLWVLATLGQRLLGPTPQAMAHDMLLQSPNPNVSAYLGIYMTMGGFRTLTSSACAMFASPAAYLYIASIFVVLSIYGFILPASSRLRLGILAFVGFLPMTILTIVAIDYGRWLSFAVLNWWLINAALQLRGIDPLIIDRMPRRTSIAAGIAALAMGPGEYPAANLATSKISERLWHGLPAGNRIDWCDPTWRSVVSRAAAPPNRSGVERD